MIKFRPVVNQKDLILQKRQSLLGKYCLVCCEEIPATSINELCPHCGYPYEKFAECLGYDYSDHLQFFNVNLTKALDLFNRNYLWQLNPCAFCGADAVLLDKRIALYDRYYPDVNDLTKAGEFKDTLYSDVLYLSCTGCTFSTPYLHLYQFHFYRDWLSEAWDTAQSRLPLIKYIELWLPDWSLNNFILKRIKAYVAAYQERFKPQQDLFA